MQPQVAILDYGCGNLRSVYNAVREVGGEPRIVQHTRGTTFTHLIFPGQGSFGAGIDGLEANDMIRYLRGPNGQRIMPPVPILGICLGMQLMCEGSEEAPGVKGLGWLPGICHRMPLKRLPLVGWEQVGANAYYFCHSYALDLDQSSGEPSGWHCLFAHPEDYQFVAQAQNANLWAVQFHPEKSGKAGLTFLRQFLAL